MAGEGYEEDRLDCREGWRGSRLISPPLKEGGASFYSRFAERMGLN
jgi:hypothetical protein